MIGVMMASVWLGLKKNVRCLVFCCTECTSMAVILHSATPLSGIMNMFMGVKSWLYACLLYLHCSHVLRKFHTINLLTPNVNYSGRTATLTSKVAFYIFIQQI